MLRNYYYLNRTVKELNVALQNAKVREIYSQEKNSLLIALPNDENPYRHLFISTNPSLPFLIIKNDHRKAKKNILQFDWVTSDEIISKIEISKNDRLVKIEFANFELIFSIMGGKTNIFFKMDGKIIDELRKNKGDSGILERVANSEFTSENIYHKIDESVFVGLDSRRIKKEYSFIPKEIILEMKERFVEGESYKELFYKLLDELYTYEIKLFENCEEEKIRFVPSSFKVFQSKDHVEFETCNKAISKYLQLHYRYEKIKNLKKEISKQLFKELEKTANKLNNLKGRIEKGERSEEYYNYGNLLLANRYRLKKGMDSILVVDYNTNREISIKLNSKNSPQKSIDSYFEKAKDERINFKISEQLFESTEKKYNKLLQFANNLEQAVSVDDFTEIKQKLKISDKKREKKKVTDGAKLREFIIEGKYKVLVGRDSKSNDLLSIKIAKQNDYWFHARGLPGSHVVLRVENPKEGIPKNILKNVAQLAAFYSKAKTAGTAPVSYTFAKFVRKKKGMEPGKVMIEKEKVLLVRPGIPTNTEMVSEE